MTSEEQINEKCQEIANNINNLVTDAVKKIKTALEFAKTAEERAKTAEEMLVKIKQTTTEEIKKAYIIGYQSGKKAANIDSNNSGGTQKEKEENLKLVLEN